MALTRPTDHKIYIKSKSQTKFRQLPVAFVDEKFAAMEARNLMDMGYDVKIKRGKYYWFDSRKR